MASLFKPTIFSPTQNEKKALAIIPKITGTISACFSLTIVMIVLRSPKRRKQTFHRMMAALSLIDTLSSLSFAMSTWPIPSDVGEDKGTVWAVGTTATCHAQSFFIHLAVTSMLYNISLSFYYVLVIRYGWKEHAIRRIEPLLHGVPLTWGFVTALIVLCLDGFGYAILWCWIKKENNWMRWGFYYGPLVLCFVIIFINCFLTWQKVHQVESAISKYNFTGRQSEEFSASNQGSSGDVEAKTTGSQRKVSFVRGTAKRGRKEFKRSKKLAYQNLLYAGGFYVTWTFMMLSRLVQLITPSRTILLFLYIATVCAPMQGLPNILVYLLPEIMKFCKKNPHINWSRSFILAIFGSASGKGNAGLSGASTLRNIESGMDKGDGDLNNVEHSITVEGNGASMTNMDKTIHAGANPSATSEAGLVDTEGEPGCHDSSSDDSSMEDDDESYAEHKEAARQSPSSDRRSSSRFFTAWMERRCGNEWSKTSTDGTCNEMTPKTTKSSVELTTMAADDTQSGMGGLVEASSASFA